jgi:hypothetical protein
MKSASRGDLEVGQGRRPRAWLAATRSGGPGRPSAGMTTGCPKVRQADSQSVVRQFDRRAKNKKPGFEAGLLHLLLLGGAPLDAPRANRMFSKIASAFAIRAEP